MRLVLACALAALAAGAATAQDEAVLGGWALPEGTVVSTAGYQTWTAALTMPNELEVVQLITSDDSTHVRLYDVQDGRLMGARTTVVRRVHQTETRYHGQVVNRDERESPLVGLTTLVVRTADGWSETAPGATPEQEAERIKHVNFDDVEYPDRAVQVGETWEVDRAAIAAIYGPLAPDYPHRLTLRLDSLGTYAGGPAAFLWQSCDVVTQPEEGLSVRMQMTARVVRRLDWMIDVLTAWEGDVRMEVPTPEGLVLMEGWMRRGDRQDVTLPGGE